MRNSSIARGLMIASLLVFGATDALGQVVYLPTYRVFAVQTSVLVPDQGIAFVGGVGHGFWGPHSFHRHPFGWHAGPWRHGWWHHHHAVPVWGGFPVVSPFFGCRSWGFSYGFASTSVSATVIDHQAWDAAVLAQARAMRNPPPKGGRQEAIAASEMPAAQPLDPVARQANWIRANLSETPPIATMPADDLAKIAAARQSDRQQRDAAEIQSLIEKGDQSRLAGDLGVARIFYRTAQRQGSGVWQRIAQERLWQLDPRKAPERSQAERTEIAQHQTSDEAESR